MGEASFVFQWVGNAFSDVWNTLYTRAGWLGLFVISSFVIRLAWKYLCKVIIR